MSTLASKAVSPDVVLRFTKPTTAAKAPETDKRIEELERKVRSMAKLREEVGSLRRQIQQLTGFMLTMSHGRTRKGLENREAEIRDVAQWVAGELGVSMDELRSTTARKDPRMSTARKAAMWVAYQFRPYVLRDIAKAFNRKDHVTVWKAIRSMDEKQVALAQKLLDAYRRNNHAEAEIASGNGTSGQGQGMAKKDERPLPGTDGERQA